MILGQKTTENDEEFSKKKFPTRCSYTSSEDKNQRISDTEMATEKEAVKLTNQNEESLTVVTSEPVTDLLFRYQPNQSLSGRF